MSHDPVFLPLMHSDLPDSISLLASLCPAESSGEMNRERERRDGDYLLRELLHHVDGGEAWALDRVEGCKPVAHRNGRTAWLSLSHTSSVIAAAASLEFDLGLDLEPVGRTISLAIGQRILHPEESRWWNRDQNREMLQLWTLKEAALKRCGTGLRTRMNGVRVEPVRPGRFRITLENHTPMEALSWNDHGHWISLAWAEAG